MSPKSSGGGALSTVTAASAGPKIAHLLALLVFSACFVIGLQLAGYRKGRVYQFLRPQTGLAKAAEAMKQETCFDEKKDSQCSCRRCIAGAAPQKTVVCFINVTCCDN